MKLAERREGANEEIENSRDVAPPPPDILTPNATGVRLPDIVPRDREICFLYILATGLGRVPENSVFYTDPMLPDR